MKNYVLRTSREDHQGDPCFALDYDAELNEAQLQVVKKFDGPILVIAGAGSGKTRTLTYRVARMVESGIAPESILLLTFTRKAAHEMLQRAAAILDARCERVAGGTFHAFGNLTLRKYGRAINVEPGFTILDQADAEDVVDLLIDQLGFKKLNKYFPKKKTVHAMLSKAVNTCLPVHRVIEKYYAGYLEELPALTQLAAEFTAYKLAHQLLDYDDLLVYTRRLLEEQQEICERLSRTYRYIMVDEYQDTNLIQAQIVRLLASAHNNIMAVGDEAQSIYAFRGANYRNILDFPQQFPGTCIIKLEENYRSVQPILNLTNNIIQQARESFRKRLFTKQSGGASPVLVPTISERQQSQFVAQRILDLHEEGVPLSQIAVLFRSSFHSFDLELELNKRHIPFVKVGGLKFVESAHIKDVLAHLRILVNPLDSVSWRRVLLLLDGIGSKTASKILQEIQKQAEPFAYLAEYPGKTKYRLDIQRLGKILCQIVSLPPSEQVQRVREYYAPILRARFDDDVTKREQDLEQLNFMTEQFRSLEAFLTEMMLEPPSRSIGNVVQTQDSDEERLVLSTIHSAKGLEWHSVFIIWLSEGRFPSAYALDDADAIEEELRLLYVAATRAMRNLYLSYPMSDRQWGMFFPKPSRFLERISQKYLDVWSLSEEMDDRYVEDRL